MSSERELLIRAKYTLDIEYSEDLINDINELLAKPERNWVEYQRGYSTVVLDLKRNLENIFIGMGYEE